MKYSAAIFDVDGTLYRGTTMFDFLDYYCRQEGRRRDASELLDRITRRKTDGAPRVVTAGMYYDFFIGISYSRLVDHGAAWYEQEGAPRLLTTVASSFTRVAADSGHGVLVSGSFTPCLLPLAAHVNSTQILCTNLIVQDDTIVGHSAPMLGTAKTDAVLAWAASEGVELGRALSAGDHVSDVSFMSLTGRQLVVGNDQNLASKAAHLSWNVAEADEF